jgi:hypothetical protein
MNPNIQPIHRRRKRPRIRVTVPEPQTGFRRAGDILMEELLRAATHIRSPRERRKYLARINKVQKRTKTTRK